MSFDRGACNLSGKSIDVLISLFIGISALHELEAFTLISFTFDDFLKNGLKLVNSSNNISNGREKKLIKFLDEYLKITKK